MRAFLCEGTGGKWAIEWDPDPWDVRRSCVRAQGRSGSLLLFPSEAAAKDHIALMKERDMQDVMDNQPAPTKPPRVTKVKDA